jgi:hypothetical protein
LTSKITNVSAGANGLTGKITPEGIPSTFLPILRLVGHRIASFGFPMPAGSSEQRPPKLGLVFGVWNPASFRKSRQTSASLSKITFFAQPPARPIIKIKILRSFSSVSRLRISQDR